MSKFVKLAAAAAVAMSMGLGLASAPDARAVTYPISAPAEIEGLEWYILTDPEGVNPTQTAFWIPSINPAPHKVIPVLEETFSLTGLTQVFGSGECGGIVFCDESDEDNKMGRINLGDDSATVFGIKFDNMYIAFHFPTAISVFEIGNLWAGVSGILAFNHDPSVVPLPAGLLLFLTGLAGVGFLGRFNAKRRRPELA